MSRNENRLMVEQPPKQQGIRNLGLDAIRLKEQERCKALEKTLADRLAETTAITLEIGCGHGHYLAAYAAAHPSELCVGLDLKKQRVERTQRKANRAGLENLWVLKAEATELLKSLPKHIAIKNALILFPDPWPKKRHWKNRLIQDDFLSLLAYRCQEKAYLYFRTDYEPYFQWAEEHIKAHTYWQVDAKAPWLFEQETLFQSRAESHQSLVAQCLTVNQNKQ